MRWNWSAVCAVTVLAGCGSQAPSAGTPATPPAHSSAAPNPAASESPAATGMGADAAATPSPTGTAKNDRKFIEGIPYDVFFDDPLTVAADGNVVATVKPSLPAAESAKTPEMNNSTTPTPATGGAVKWSDLLTGEDLQNEAKRIRIHLAASLKNQATYNSNYRELSIDGAVMAAMATTVLNEPDAVSWQKNSTYVQEYGSQIWQASSSANALGKEPFDKVKTAAENLMSALDGNSPADPPQPPAPRKFVEVAHRKGLMKRIERASEFLKSNINTESKLKSETDAVVHESRIIAAFGQVVAQDGYDSADEPEYQKYARDLIQGGKDAAESAAQADFERFQSALNMIQKACTDCHGDYGTDG